MIRFFLLIVVLVGFAVVFSPGKPADDWDIHDPRLICRHPGSVYHISDQIACNISNRDGESSSESPIAYFRRKQGIHAHE